MERLQDFDISNQFQALVMQSDRITAEDPSDEVRHMILEVHRDDITFQLGQNVGVLVPGPHEFGSPHHLRLYTIAGAGESQPKNGKSVSICVRRCFYIDDFSGERHPGVASNYLCDRKPGDSITLTGPYGSVFKLPANKNANLLMVGMGTGIAPFRAFVKHIYDDLGGWTGKVRLFYGAKTGLEMLYRNDRKNDLANYYDEATFKAFEAVSPRPALDAPVALDRMIEDNAEEVWGLIQHPDTYVYVAGLEKARELLDKALSNIAGSQDAWRRKKAELVAGERWAELVY
jgi:ferredoxin--NADP+ reductase